MKYSKILRTSIIFLLIFHCTTIVYGFEEEIVLGREDNWKDFISLSHIIKKEGKWGTFDLTLDDAEADTTPATDLLIHFNSKHLRDETGKYTISGNSIMISNKKPVFGEGSGIFERNLYTLFLKPQTGALFESGRLWGDFTLQFWMQPVTLSNSEVILSWAGSHLVDSEILHQSLKCSLHERTLKWEFKNFFLPLAGDSFNVELTGITQLLPRTWYHHMIRFDSSTGLLEYLVDGIPEAILYTTKNYTEGGNVYLPFIGKILSSEFKIGEFYTGLIDELSLSTEFVNTPVKTKYSEIKGRGMSRVFDTKYTGSLLKSINAIYSKPDETEIHFYYRTADIMPLWNDLGSEWQQFNPGEIFDMQTRGRYIQVLVELFPDGNYTHSPVISSMTIVYEPDLPPPPPPDLIAIPGNRKIILTWKRVNHQDVIGYKIYYGDKPGHYHGKDGREGESPIDAGNVTEFEITGLQNGKIYYFTIIAYDNSEIPHTSMFSKEVHARPSGLLE